VIVDDDDPSAVIDPGVAEIVDVVADAAPGVKVTNASPLVIAPPAVVPGSIVPLTSAGDPAVVVLVNVAVYVPSPLSATVLSEPADELNATASPPEVSSIPLASLA
jgi:hypothetical protein